ncbi:putative transmembrane protein [Burkholderia mallei]|nr:putative transmembrane protein [Burkholderia mallei]KOT10972.1 putative transmembrane protein [Burkholderia mallei]
MHSGVRASRGSVRHASRAAVAGIRLALRNRRDKESPIEPASPFACRRRHAQQSPGSHARVLDRQDHVDDGRGDRRRLSRRPRGARRRRHGRADGLPAGRRARAAMARARLCAMDLLAEYRPRQRRRYADHRRAHRRSRRQPPRQHAAFRRRARGDVRALVSQRAHAVDPYDRHAAPRGVLLGRDPADVRARHGGGRSRDRGARPRIPARDRRVRRRDRARRGGRARRDEPRARVLARVHPHASARRVAR